MADHADEPKSPVEKIHGHDSSSSSDSDSEDKSNALYTAQSNIFRLFGREKPVHKVLGGGKRTVFCVVLLTPVFMLWVTENNAVSILGTDISTIFLAALLAPHMRAADVFLWRNKKISAGVLCGATALWVLFELLEYHLVTLVCHILVLSLAILFLWSNASTFINKSPPRIPEIRLPENCVLEFASALRVEVNRALAVLRDIASGRNLKKFLGVVAGLWVLSLIGKWCNFLTLFYIAFVLLHTLPVIYEKYEDRVDSFAEKAVAEFKKHYAVFDSKVLSKIPRGPLKDKKKN